jgi:hypothetical protein
MINVSLLELLKIWGELVECYHGLNDFGGDTVELYAYRFQPYSPLGHSEAKQLVDSSLKLDTLAEIERRGAVSLFNIVRELCKQFECSAEIDGIPSNDWMWEIQDRKRVFDHRAHVSIIR